MKTELTKENYFDDTKLLSNSQLKNFVRYNKWGTRILTPDIYLAYKNKAVEFESSDAMIIGKAVDEYFDKTNTLFLNNGGLFEKYLQVSKRKSDNPDSSIIEITGVMTDTIKKTIQWGKSMQSFKDIIKDEKYVSQKILLGSIEIVDETDGEVYTIQMKGLPDYCNETEKKLVDLKYTGSLDMIIDSLQFKGQPILKGGYIQQQAIYNKLLGGGYDGCIILLTDNGCINIDISNEILEKSWLAIESDILDLAKFIEGEKLINTSIFDLSKNETEDEFDLI